MKGEMLIFRPGEAKPERQVRYDAPSLPQIHEIIGGYMEMPCRWFAAGRQVQVICNEEAMRMELPPNLAGTRWIIEACRVNGQSIPNMAGGAILGPVLVLIGEACID